ncbi:MAG: pyroglutamyl-peptidase I [Arthrobacter sp.]|jgi:pyroglutamyl-peptidase|nr:pyroglutamyl-peptidase I [Arthrobacter sp.]
MILFTGFEPFGGAAENPSRQASSRAAELSRRAGREAVHVELPCTFEGARAVLAAAVAEHRPGVIVCAGLADGRERISLERVALNLIDARIPDNAGAQPVDVPVEEGAPLALPTRLPVKRAAARLTEAGLPAELSLSAGSYVCNTVFYAALRLAPADVSAGFVHVPPAAAVPIGEQARALELIAATAWEGEAELRVPGGSEY